MTTQLAEWQGAFGRAYTDRNIVDWTTRIDGFRHMLTNVGARTVLEVGCNRGHNLLALRSLGYMVRGVEPNRYARGLARGAGLNVRDGHVDELLIPDGSFDLVFTSGVLIHVPPERLAAALAELVRVSRRYVLAVEYGGDRDEPVIYRGRDDMMWRRDYGAHLASLPDVRLLRSGQLGPEFDRAGFWLAEKSRADRSG